MLIIECRMSQANSSFLKLLIDALLLCWKNNFIFVIQYALTFVESVLSRPVHRHNKTEHFSVSHKADWILVRQKKLCSAPSWLKFFFTYEDKDFLSQKEQDHEWNFIHADGNLGEVLTSQKHGWSFTACMQSLLNKWGRWGLVCSTHLVRHKTSLLEPWYQICLKRWYLQPF